MQGLDMKMSGIGVHDMKLPKNQLNIMLNKTTFLVLLSPPLFLIVSSFRLRRQQQISKIFWTRMDFCMVINS